MGWLTGWTYRKSHLITGSAEAVANYQTCIKVYKTTGTDGTETVRGITAGKVYVGSNCRDDFGDIRFTDDNGTTELDYWMESSVSGASAVFWVKVTDSLASDQTIYVYYGKSDGVTTSNGTNTFKVFFNGDSTGWTVTDPNTRFSFGSGKLTWTNLTRNEDAYVYKSVSALGSTFLIRFSAMTDLINASAIVGMMQHSDNVDDNANFDNGWAIEDNHKQYLYMKRRKADVSAYSSACAGRSDATQYWYVMYISGNNLTLKCYSNSTFVTQVGSTITRDISDITLANLVYFFLVASLNSGSNLRCTGYVTEVIVRQWIASEPAHSTWGTEESIPLYDLDVAFEKTDITKTSSIDVIFDTLYWYSDWKYRKSHGITGSSGASTDYQVCIKVYKGSGTDGTETVNGFGAGKIYCNSHCLDDFGDIRFTSHDGKTLLSYWMESLSSGNYAIFWVKITSDLNFNSLIYIYYGKSTATTTSSGNDTFVFFEDFEDVSDWTATLGSGDTWTADTAVYQKGIASGKLYYSSGGACSIKRAKSVSSGFVVEFWMRAHQTNKYGVVYLNKASDNFTDAWNIYFQTNSMIGYYDGAFHNLTSYSADVWYRVDMVCKSTGKIDIYINGGKYLTNGNPKGSLTSIAQILLGPSGGGDATETLWFDDMFVRKWITTEPTHSDWGIEEEHPKLTYSIDVAMLNFGGISFKLDTLLKELNVTIPTLVDIKVSPAWLAGWLYRKSHVITGSIGAGTDYQVCIKVYKGSGTDGTETVNGNIVGKVYCNGLCRNDFGDIRFTDNDAMTLLKYWIQEVSSGNYAIFWVKITEDLDLDTTIYVYYDNSVTTSIADGKNTFRMFDEEWTELSAFPEYTIATGNGTPRCPIGRLIVCPNGDLLAFYNRGTSENQLDFDIYMERSIDGGITWGDETLLCSKKIGYGVGGGQPLLTSNKILLPYIKWYSLSKTELWQKESTDNGLTWVNDKMIYDGGSHHYVDLEQEGIKLVIGTYAGRLLQPISWATSLPAGADWKSGCLYSDDDGDTWIEGGSVAQGGYSCDEPSAVELSDGSLYMLMRNTSGGKSTQSTSTDGGATWSTATQSSLTNNDTPVCLFRVSFSPNIILVSWDNQSLSLRRPLDIALSTDDCTTWINTKVIKNAGYPTAYPSIAYTSSDGYIILAYWDYTSPEAVKNTRFLLSRITDPIWQGDIDNVTLSAGIATLSGNNKHIDGTKKHSPPFRLMHKVKISSDSIEGAILGTGDAGNDYSYIPENGEFYYSMSTGDGNHRIYVRNSDSNTSKATNISGLSGYHIREITHTSTHVIFKNDGSQEVDITSNIPTQDVSIWYESKTNCNVLINWAFLAKYISPEPAHSTWGIEESVVRIIIDSIDILFKKFGVLKTDSIDILFKKFGVLKTDSIDILFKKLGLNQTYDTDVLLNNAKQLSCFLDVMLVSAKIIGIGGGHPVEMDRRIAKGIVKYIERNFNFKVIALKVVSVRCQQKIPAKELQIVQKVESNKSVSELKIVEKSYHSNRMAGLDIVKPYSQFVSLNKLAIARECPQSVSLIELAVIKEQPYSIALMELQLSKEQIAGFGIDSLNILSERGMIFASAGLDIVSKNTLSVSVESLSTRKKKMTKRELIDLLDKLDELD